MITLPLSITWGPDPEIFSFGALHIRYYSVLFVSGFIIGFWLFIKFFKRENLPVDMLDSLLYTLLIAGTLGARLGHCFFYEPNYYLSHPIEILKIWEGGLASHGGALGILIAIFFWVRKYGPKYNFDYVWLLDKLGIATPLAGALIRFGNFMNSEIYGDVTDLPWGVIFTLKGETLPKHPTQLYEALCYLLLFGLQMVIWKKWLPKMKRGVFFGIFFIGIFASRFVIEFIKEPQVAFEEGMRLNMGQLLSIPFILAGVGFIIYGYVSKKPAMVEPEPAKKKRETTLTDNVRVKREN